MDNITSKTLPTPAHMDYIKRGMIGIVHYGLNTYTDQEWGYGDVSPKMFTPDSLDPEQWVLAAKAGGLKCLVFVCKHHDGFCLWPSKLNPDYTIANTPWKDGKGDLVQELHDACLKHGLDFGVYLSPWDRHQAEYARPAYVDYFHAQWDELMAKYGPISEIWLDGANGGDGWYGGAKEKRSIPKDYYKLPWLQERLIKAYPRAVAFGGKGQNCSHWCGNECGYNAETCRNDTGEYWSPVETDTPFRRGWFWHPHDAPKSLKELVEDYFKSVGRNSVLNFGIAPNRHGLVGDDDVARLKEFGDYVRAFEGTDFAAGAKRAVSDDGMTVTLKLAAKAKFNAVDVGENIVNGQRVDAWKFEVKSGAEWQTIAEATTIGYRRILRFAEVEADEVRVVVTKSDAVPEILAFALRFAPEVKEEIVADGIDVISKSDLIIGYPEDGSFVMYGRNDNPIIEISGFVYTPPEGTLDGVVDGWAVETIDDFKSPWKVAYEGRFGNMRANPVKQIVTLEKPVSGVRVRVRATSSIEGQPLFFVDKMEVFR